MKKVEQLISFSTLLIRCYSTLFIFVMSKIQNEKTKMLTPRKMRLERSKPAA